MKLSSVIVLLITTLHLNMVAQSSPDLIMPQKPEDVILWNVAALSKRGGEKLGYEELAVFVTNAMGENSPIPVQGKFSLHAAYLVFTPYFPFERGLTYTVRTKLSDTDQYAYYEFRLEADKVPEIAELLQIYPSGEALPENLLRFYFYFNTPMKKGEALKHIHLVDAGGTVDKQAFMQFKQELWSPDGKRLTLLFDPGRIKRGVSTNMELGPSLLKGKRYQLMISNEWQDVYGQSLVNHTTKQIQVVNAYRHHIKIDEWEIDIPKVNTNQGVTVRFDRIMDYALIQSMITMEDVNHNQIAGYWKTLEHEKQIQFIPEKNWQKGTYQIVFDHRLEDVAGNNLQVLLDQIASKEARPVRTYQTIAFKL